MKNQTYRTKNQVVYEMIRDAITTGKFAPGSRIVIDDLALQYGISHSPIRECLSLLEADGFVHIRPYAGVVVTELKPELIMEVFALLESLEIISSCRASNRATAADLKALDQLIVEMEQYATSPEKWSAKNIELHMTICEIAEMTMTKNIMYRALYHWDRLRRYYLEEVSSRRIKQAHEEHRELLEAIRTGDEVHIKNIIQHHNKAALDDYLKHIRATQEIDLHPVYPY